MEELIETLTNQSNDVLQSFARALKDSEKEKEKISKGEENNE